MHSLVGDCKFTLLTATRLPVKVRERGYLLHNEYAMSTTTKNGSPRSYHCCELALRLLAAYGLRDWSFAFNRSKRQMGCCRYGPRSSSYLSTSSSGTISI